MNLQPRYSKYQWSTTYAQRDSLKRFPNTEIMWHWKQETLQSCELKTQLNRRTAINIQLHVTTRNSFSLAASAFLHSPERENSFLFLLFSRKMKTVVNFPGCFSRILDFPHARNIFLGVLNRPTCNKVNQKIPAVSSPHLSSQEGFQV